MVGMNTWGTMTIGTESIDEPYQYVFIDIDGKKVRMNLKQARRFQDLIEKFVDTIDSDVPRIYIGPPERIPFG